jgi:hypothetical protein
LTGLGAAQPGEPPWDARPVRHNGRWRAKSSAVFAVPLLLAAALAGCSASSPAPAPDHSADTASATAQPRPTATAITIAGDHPVPGNGSQDTYAQTPGTRCDSTTFARDKALGGKIAAGFSSAGLSVSADLLTHFLRGTGTGVDFRAGSVISKQALASAAFQAMDSQVQTAVLSQLKAGRTSVRLPAAQLPTVTFASSGGDLYWGFRGAQGLAVTGTVHRADGRLVHRPPLLRHTGQLRLPGR